MQIQNITQNQKSSLNNVIQHENYIITLFTHLSQKISLNIVDRGNKKEYSIQEYTLTKINPQTVLRALKGQNSPSFRFQINDQNNNNQDKNTVKGDHSKGGEEQIIISIFVQMPFILPINQVIHIKKIRDISDIQLLTFEVEKIRNRVKQISKSSKPSDRQLFYGARLQNQQIRNAQNFQTLASISLPKGNYILTFSFIARPLNSWIYIYFNNQALRFANQSGFYYPGNGSWHAHVLKLKHTVNQQQQQTLSFQTYYGSSYTFDIKNCIITAKRTVD